MGYSLSEKQFNFINYFFFFLVFIFVINRPLELFPDSQGYLDMSMNRPPIYPLFLQTINAISTTYFDLIIRILQFLFGVLSINYFVKFVKANFKINNLWILILTLILLLPYFSENYIANRLLSEAIAYPLFLIIVSMIIKFFLSEKKKYLIKSYPLICLLLLTRIQFLFLIPIIIISLSFLSHKNKTYLKNIWVFVLFLILPSITSNIDAIYHKIVHGHYVTTPWTGIHLISSAFYVADKDDFKLYEDSNERQFFKEIFAEIEKKSLNINYLDIDSHNSTEYYIDNYNNLVNFTLYDYGKGLVGEELTENERFIELDKITKSMYLPLVGDNFGAWLKIYVNNFINAFGNIKYLMVIMILFGFSIIQLILKPNNHVKFMFLGCSFLIANAAILTVGVHTIDRLLFYNDWVLFLIVFILLDLMAKRVLINRPKNEEIQELE